MRVWEHRFFILICLLLLFMINLMGDTLEDKQAELEKLTRELEEMETIIDQTQAQKAEKQAKMLEMQKKKAELENTICKLEVNQCKAREEWDKTRERLEKTSEYLDSKKENIQGLYNSAHELGRALITSHYLRQLYPNADAWVLATGLEAASEDLQELNADISNLENTRKALAKKEQRDAKYFKDVQWTKIISKKRKTKYQNQLVTLDKEVSSLDQEYNEALKRKKELEEAQAEMNNLVSRLQRRTTYEPVYSYKFSYDKLIWPVEGKLIRSFGDYQGQNRRLTLHNDGIDIAVDIGTEVKCVDKGVVAYSSRNGGSGRVVIVDHQNGYYTVYSHNDHLMVSLGDTVEKGTVLARSGQSGLVKEPCLHFEIRKDGKAVNPLEYLEF